MLGNAAEVCFDSPIGRMDQDKVVEDTPTIGPVAAGDTRVVRGGFYNSSELELKCGRRCVGTSPMRRSTKTGFRPARTYR